MIQVVLHRVDLMWQKIFIGLPRFFFGIPYHVEEGDTLSKFIPIILHTSHSAEDFSAAVEFNGAGGGKMKLGLSPFCSNSAYVMMMTYDCSNWD